MHAHATLPEELILQIVARLPVKTVGRCRCVSRWWRYLFSDPQFTKSHFQLSHKHQALLYPLDNGEFRAVDFDLSNAASFEKESLVLRDLKAPSEDDYLRLLGSCNGLVALQYFSDEFLGEKESLFIWNPTTGFFKKLPSRRHVSTKFIFGFGCASSCDEYKLVMGAEIFSSKTNSWKSIAIPRCRFRQLNGVLCRDALHWRVYPDDEDHNGKDLYAFDLEKEKFSMMKMPKPRGRFGAIADYGVTCEGCLFVMHVDQESLITYVFEFWVMREYGNNDSWTRSFGVRIPRSLATFSLKFRAISVMETSAFVSNEVPGEEKVMSTTYHRNEEENTSIHITESSSCANVVYEESLYRLA